MFHFRNFYIFKNALRYYSTSMNKVLNVAEKNDAAKNIANIMGRGAIRRREGYSRFNKIYEFDYNLPNFGTCKMIMTSVSGHLLDIDFDDSHRKWYSCSPIELFSAPLVTLCPKQFLDIKKTLEREVKNCNILCIWTDCDREGENIGFEIIQVCKNIKPNIRVLRAKFSEITSRSINNAVKNFSSPNSNLNNAVKIRRELDLRIGAAFTRFQTMKISDGIGDPLKGRLISYGPCQFPTLGFVVERYKQIKEFVPQKFWYIDVTYERDGHTVNFLWDRHRVFDEDVCLSLYHKVLLDPKAKVVNLITKQVSNWRPLPMDTVLLEKLASTNLKMTSKVTMKIAEKLYTKGLISYPRTETNIFPSNLDLSPYVSNQVSNPWGNFAEKVLQWGINPRKGKKTDNAHPPIYPIKMSEDMSNDEKKLYELIARHFLACISKDAIGLETVVEIDINGELFNASGLVILERNYLEVYPYTSWKAKELPSFKLDEVFLANSLIIKEGQTTPPSLLSESDLIALMEKHGIGTDATHAEHIETIQQRLYVEFTRNRKFIPCQLGLGLVDGYKEMGLQLSRPYLRSSFEKDLQAICNGAKCSDEVLKEQIDLYKEMFSKLSDRYLQLVSSLKKSLNEEITI